jgi:ABC-type sugar transport system ATPase subunit
MSLIEMRGISKSFGQNRVLSDVDFTLEPGEVHALLGENGAGKSTLMKILMGVHQPDAGTITLDGEEIIGRSVGEHLNQGIAMIFQELSLVPNGTVADNIFLGREPHGLGWRVDRRAMRREAARLIELYGFALSLKTEIGRLPFAQRQMVEILKAVARGARVLIMDEPTSSLTMHEEAALMGIIAELKSRGIGIVYISHRMAEIFAVSDRISLVKDGQLIGPMRPAETSVAHISGLMSRGVATVELARGNAARPGTPALEVRGLSTAGKLRDIGFSVAAGEVVGLAGLVGSGRSTLAKALFGLLPDRAGEVLVDGRVVPPGDPADAAKAGLALVPEDRRREGLVLDQGLAANISLPNLDRLRLGGGWPIFSRSAADALFGKFRTALAINARGPRQAAAELSGGNQQKVVFAKWLATSPRVLILDEPTSGVDVNAKAEMRALMRRTAAEGVGVLLISSELEELATTADRVLLMIDGRITREAEPGLHEAGLRAMLQDEVASSKRPVIA